MNKNSMNVGVITGGNNNFSQKNIYNNGVGGKPSTDDPAATAVGAGLSVFALTVVIAVNYLHHYETIAFWLKLDVVAGGVLHLLTLLSQAFDGAYRYRDSLAPGGGVALAALIAWLILVTFTTLPDQVFFIASQPPSASGYFQGKWEVWQRLSSYGHRLVLENLASALFLATGVAFNLAFGLQQMLESAARVLSSSVLATLSRGLRFFKSVGAFVAAMAVLGAYLAISGVLTALIA